MGFDINGLDYKNNKGVYFRNTQWYWPKLWLFVCFLNKDILTEDEINSGYYNDGLTIDKKRAEKIAKRLKKALKEKRKYPKKWIKNLKSSDADACEEFGKNVSKAFTGSVEIDGNENGNDFYFNWINVREFMEFAENSGGFEIF